MARRTGDDKLRSYTQDLLARARELRTSSAFEPPSVVEQTVSVQDVKRQMRASRKKARRTIVVLVVVALAVALFSLCVPFYSMEYAGPGYLFAPGDVLDCWATWFAVNVGPIFDGNLTGKGTLLWRQYMQAHPGVEYKYMLDRGMVTAVVVVCGCMLAASGLLFQTAFRNPLATPSMLGVADGVTLGCTIFAMSGHAFISEDAPMYLLLVYGCGAAVLAVVFALSRFIAGGARYNVFDLLLVGTVLTQLLSGLNNHIANFIMDMSTWERFYELTQAFDSLYEPLTYRVVAVFAVITIVPALLLRFRLNLIAFDDGEVRLSGVHPGLLRGLALLLGSFMQLAAIASIGQVAMLSLAVPFLVRYLLPSEFRFQLVGNFLLGSVVLLACMALQPYLVINFVTMPVGTVVGVLVVPLFLWMVALQRRGWE